MRVAFTGPAEDHEGVPVLRVDVTRAAVEAGHVVREKIDKSVDILVASRSDTGKARHAEKQGVHVTSYQEFAQMLLDDGVEIVRSGGPPDKYTDQSPQVWDGKFGSLL